MSDLLLDRSLLFLKEEGILHQDIKPDNFIIMQDGTMKLADFGLSAEIGPQEQHRPVSGTYYMTVSNFTVGSGLIPVLL